MEYSYFNMEAAGNKFCIMGWGRDSFDFCDVPPDEHLPNLAMDFRNSEGIDQLILMLPDDKEGYRMRVFNAGNGSEAENCGNARLCLKSLWEDRLEKEGKLIKVDMNADYNVKHHTINVEPMTKEQEDEWKKHPHYENWEKAIAEMTSGYQVIAGSCGRYFRTSNDNISLSKTPIASKAPSCLDHDAWIDAREIVGYDFQAGETLWCEEYDEKVKEYFKESVNES